MPPLENPRHEAVLRKATDPNEKITFMNIGKAYREVYPVKNAETSWANASRMLGNARSKERFLELMERQGLTDDKFNDVHHELLGNKDGNLRYKALRLGHELKGRLNNLKNQNSNFPQLTQINIVIENSDNFKDKAP